MRLALRVGVAVDDKKVGAIRGNNETLLPLDGKISVL